MKVHKVPLTTSEKKRKAAQKQKALQAVDAKYRRMKEQVKAQMKKVREKAREKIRDAKKKAREKAQQKAAAIRRQHRHAEVTAGALSSVLGPAVKKVGKGLAKALASPGGQATVRGTGKLAKTAAKAAVIQSLVTLAYRMTLDGYERHKKAILGVQDRVIASLHKKMKDIEAQRKSEREKVSSQFS